MRQLNQHRTVITHIHTQYDAFILFYLNFQIQPDNEINDDDNTRLVNQFTLKTQREKQKYGCLMSHKVSIRSQRQSPEVCLYRSMFGCQVILFKGEFQRNA